MKYRPFLYYYLTFIFFHPSTCKKFSFIVLLIVSRLPLRDDMTNGVSHHHILSQTPHCHIITFNDMSLIRHDDVTLHLPRYHLIEDN